MASIQDHINQLKKLIQTKEDFELVQQAFSSFVEFQLSNLPKDGKLHVYPSKLYEYDKKKIGCYEDDFRGFIEVWVRVSWKNGDDEMKIIHIYSKEECQERNLCWQEWQDYAVYAEDLFLKETIDSEDQSDCVHVMRAGWRDSENFADYPYPALVFFRRAEASDFEPDKEYTILTEKCSVYHITTKKEFDEDAQEDYIRFQFFGDYDEYQRGNLSESYSSFTCDDDQVMICILEKK